MRPSPATIAFHSTENQFPPPPIIRTLDQARAVVTFLDAASEKTLRSTVALTASRGRGKSASLGLAVAGALAMGYANVFVTAPSPENVRTLVRVLVGERGVGVEGRCGRW